VDGHSAVVGSWSRPPWLVQALRRRQGDELSSEECTRLADEAVLLAVNYREDAGRYRAFQGTASNVGAVEGREH
jgi:methionine synthase II (cobalamin-independent)